MSPNWQESENSGGSSKFFDPRGYIRERVKLLADVLGAKEPTDGRIMSFQDGLERYCESALRKAFNRAEQELERFPTPKTMKSFCNEESPSESWKYDFKPGNDNNGNKCLIDPNAEGADRFMYLPQNCEEGKRFLAKLKEIAGRK